MSKTEFEFGLPTTLPDGWKWMPLEDLMDQPKQDIVDGPFGSNLKASEYVEEGILIARLQIGKGLKSQRPIIVQIPFDQRKADLGKASGKSA